MLSKKLKNKIEDRKKNNALRSLPIALNLIDFSSNDYLGFADSSEIFENTHQFLKSNSIAQNGATGSRLLSGNHSMYSVLEDKLCDLYKSESALVFNSGYDANVGFFGCVPQKGDIVLYDAFCHASIRDGIKLSQAKSYKFKHNDLDDLERLLSLRVQSRNIEDSIYVVTESVFSMDGDSPNLSAIANLCKKHNALLVVDEAHAIGVVGENGEGLVQQLGLQRSIFATIITFGKTMGCHGAAILGSKELQIYLLNFARSFIYTTALSPHSIASIIASYNFLESLQGRKQIELLRDNIAFFKHQITIYKLASIFIKSETAIQSMVVGGNEKTKKLAKEIQSAGFNVKPILYPTVPKGAERLRICLHSFNTQEEISNLLKSIQENL